MRVSLIVAAAKSRVIGKDNKLLWHISEDLKHFKRITMGKPVVMGRKTFESLPFKPLPGRENIVITRNDLWQFDGVKVAHSLDQALNSLADHAEIMVIGGGQIYKAALPKAERIYYTDVDLEIEGDTLFPEIGAEWAEVAREDHPAERGNPAYSFLQYDRVKV